MRHSWLQWAPVVLRFQRFILVPPNTYLPHPLLFPAVALMASPAPGPLVEVNSVATGASARLARQLPCTYTNTIGTLYEEPCVVIVKVTLVCMLDVDRLLKSHAAADAIAAAEAAAAAADAASVAASGGSQPGG